MKTVLFLFCFLISSLIGVWCQNPKIFRENGKIGYKNADGKVVIPAIYDTGTEYMVGNHAVVQKNNKWGMIDTNGKILIPFEYEGVKLGCSEVAAVMKNQKWGVVEINTNKIIIPFEYEDIGNTFIKKIRGVDTNKTYDINEGWIAAKENGKWGFISESNKKETNFIFEDVDNDCLTLSLTLGDKIFIFSGKLKHLPAVFINNKWLEVVYDEEKKDISVIEIKSKVAKSGDFNYDPNQKK